MQWVSGTQIFNEHKNTTILESTHQIKINHG